MGRILKRTTLTGKQSLAMMKLVKGISPSSVAQEMGMSVGTIYTWQKSPVFLERQAQYVESLARQEMDRGLQEAEVTLHESSSAIVQWMLNVVLGVTECKDKNRWRMALDFLHHAGIIDQQVLAKNSALEAQGHSINLNLDQRRQSILAAGNQELQSQLEKFSPLRPGS